MNEFELLPVTLGALLAEARARLADPREAPILVAHALGLEREMLYAHPERPVASAMAAAALALVARRAAGEPVAYLTCQREFYGLPLTVGPGALIPRPETELLVTLALACLRETNVPRIADLGTGSGTIALTLARERPDAHIVASDLSAAALDFAVTNACAIGLRNVRFVRADWLAPFAATAFDLIVSNPPYIAAGDPHLAQGDLRYEPQCALAAGADGLDAIRHLLTAAGRCLKPGGRLVIEHGAGQQDDVIAFARTGGWLEISGHHDCAGLPRAVIARRGK